MLVSWFGGRLVLEVTNRNYKGFLYMHANASKSKLSTRRIKRKKQVAKKSCMIGGEHRIPKGSCHERKSKKGKENNLSSYRKS